MASTSCSVAPMSPSQSAARANDLPETRAPSLRVGFLIDRWEPERGGAERALAALAQHLIRRGHRVCVFARRADADPEVEFHPVRALGFTREGRERVLARELQAAAERERIDVTIGIRHLESVDVFWPHAGAHARGLAATREARAQGRKLGEGAADEAAKGRHRLFQDLERRLCEGGAGAIVCVSALVAAELRELYPSCAGRLTVVENGVDLRRFDPARREAHRASLRARLGIDPARPIVGFLAHDATLKGLPALLDALRLIPRDDVSLALVGARDLDAWRARAERVLGAARVAVLPKIDAAEFLGGIDVLGHPTWRDSHGLVIVEALASGTPVVTTRRAGAASRVRAGCAGAVVESPRDLQGIAAGLGEWLGRADRGELDRAPIRACVADAGLDVWLERMEAVVVQRANDRRRC